MHLVALSGSNIVIYLWFVKVFRSKCSFSYMFLLISLLLLYFIFTRQLHPLARAIIFMTLIEFYYQIGLEKGYIKFWFILAVTTLYLLFWSNFSMSMILSLIFSISIYLYEHLKSAYFNFFGRILNHLSFSIYMFIVSIPVYIFIFKSDPSPILLLSNLLIAPVFEISLYAYYVLYLLFLSSSLDLPVILTHILNLPAQYILTLYTILTK